MGSAVRSSTATMATSSVTPAAAVARTSADPQPRSGPSETPYMSSPKPMPESRNPARSKRPGLVSACWRRNLAPKASAAAPMGTLT